MEKNGATQGDKSASFGSTAPSGGPAGTRKQAAAKAASAGPDQYVLEQFELNHDADGKNRNAFSLQEAVAQRSALDLSKYARAGLS